MIIGLPAFAELVETLGVPVLAHPALGGAARIAPPLLIGKLFRLFGADAVIYPNHGGRFSYSPEQCLAIAGAARAPWGEVRPALPVPAGGMTLQRVPEMLDFYGSDVMLLIGGGLLTAGDALLERARDFVKQVGRTK
jgi:ribulose-bisphosphate carboxylase large chain